MGASSRPMQGLGAGGKTSQTNMVKLLEAILCCGDFPGEQNGLALPPLDAVITIFPQEHIDPNHDPIEGMLGMEMLMLV